MTRRVDRSRLSASRLLDLDQDASEIGSLEGRQALERVDASESYRAIARDLPNLTRQTLMNIQKDQNASGSILTLNPPTSA